MLPSLYAIFRDTRSASATHNIYAYRIETASEIIEHYEDDGEFGAGRHILSKLREIDAKNVLVCVSRWYGGVELGQKRFNYIKEAVDDVFKL